jgi:hypothetical protein
MENVLARKPLYYAACILVACAVATGALAALSAEPASGRVRAVTIVGAGDIAYCGGKRDTATARLLGKIRGTVYTLGDNVYDRGTRSEFKNCYDPTWGKYKKRTKPSVGNHEYYTSGARPYYDYFGARAGNPRKGYYAYDRGRWHIIVLNSNCGKVSCGPNSRQANWLRNNLSNNRSKCTLAYWHHPLFASNASTKSVKPFWEILYNRNADVILSAHAHSYERFAPQTPGGRKNKARGIREFVVGTGGKPPEGPFNSRPANSQVRNDDTPGVLRLRLRSGSYAWKFVPVAGKSFSDSGTDRCH